MATLQRFKLLATQCGVAGSPTRSPSASPIHLRRRKTLRMLLSRNGTGRRRDEQFDRPIPRPEKSKAGAAAAVSLKLKDFLLSSPPPPPQKAQERVSEKVGNARARTTGVACGRGPVPVPRVSGRPLTATLRQRLLRRSWRPVLVSIPE